MKEIDMGTDHLKALKGDGLGKIIMNRPEARNAMSDEMNAAMMATLEDFENDSEVRAVILTGSEGAFCAGGDVKGMANKKDDPKRTIDIAIHEQRMHQRGTSGKLFKMPKPTIAAVNGPAAGAGMSYALSCDLRIMSDSAFFTTAFAKVGFSGDYGGSYFMTQLVGLSKAKELYFLSDKIPAEEALKLGLSMNHELEQKTLEIAKQLAEGPAVAFRYMKENLNRAVSGEVDDCLDLEVTHHVHCGQTEDHKNATKAFVEKKQPVFKGR